MTGQPPEIPHFEYRGDIGGGGFAMVHRYYHRKLKRDVAVKVPKATDLSDAVRERFIAEGESMAELGNHRNVVTVYDTDTAADGRPFLVMEYCPGGDLAKLSGRTPLSVKEVLDIGVQVAGAIETAHERRILHRDIKPANVLMNEYDKPCLTDFGIAGRFAEQNEDGEVILSVPWSAPELLDRSAVEQGGVPAEVFSLGATLWHLMVGHSPFMPRGTDNSLAAIEHRIVSGWLPTGLAAPADLQRLLLRAMARNPAARPGSVREFAVGLQRIQKAQRFGETELVLMPAPAPEDPEPAAGAPSFAAPAPPLSPPTRQRMQPVFVPPAPGPAPHTTARTGEQLFVPPTPGPAPHTTARTSEQLFAPPPSRGAEPPPLPFPLRNAAPDTHVRKPSAEKTGSQPAARSRWPLYAVGAAAIIAIVGVGLFLLSGEDKQGGGPAVTTVAEDVPDQNAGAGNAPPGRPEITATRLDENKVRFAWNYSAQQATDTFSWRTSTQNGVAKEPQVEVEGANPVCLQVKVVRADGSNATAEWSQESCG
ncbi:serine/threonine-protein kinase [Lentzea cavernae]|uniref:non-specific serine/threonine protein kinase n=1 Tax=Lentzea cavernae TaxID=2020703 RepID=A0ABQ3MFV6_9PSEU|nr:serine/threonine-protein kinase [Lentzea cavernae]GHH44347.1 serine/threonine protein kinase [Lentzea cavernae]